MIASFCFGKGGTAQAPFDLGRTATHEIGHWLDLRHIWGDDRGSCSGSDMVEDTPNQADATFNSPTFPQISCNNGPDGNMFMNYMDYTDDAAMFMFTEGPVEADGRMPGWCPGFLPDGTGIRPDWRRDGGCPAAPSAPPAAAPAPALAGQAMAAPAPATPAQASGDTELLRLRKEVEQLRRDNRKALMILEGLRAALNSDNVNAAGG